LQKPEAMIQRIQTIYLLLAVVATPVLLFFFPLAAYYSDTATLKLYLSHIQNLVPSLPLPLTLNPFLQYAGIIISIIAGIICIYTISSFKNRIKQVRLVRITLFLIILVIAWQFFITDLIRKNLSTIPDYEIGIYMPIISLIFLLLAQRAILKDERKIRAADRLR